MRYLSLGTDCSPAAVLKNIGLRDYALPFDWISSNPAMIYNCIMDDFKMFHQNLKINSKGSRLIDEYGFEFPHDYPTTKKLVDKSEVGEGTVSEAIIIDSWENCQDIVLEKYRRRIERFRTILSSAEPIIVLYRGDPSDLYFFRAAFLEKYNKENLVYVVSSTRPCDSNDTVICNTEENSEWNSSEIWLDAISKAKERSKHLTGQPN